MKRSLIQCATAVVALLVGTSAMAMTYYGPTKSGDTAWSIAKAHRMSGVSTKQMAAAIQRLNPEVFNSHGALQLGKTVEIPSAQKDLTAKPMGSTISAPTKASTPAKKTTSMNKATNQNASGTSNPSAADQSAAQSVSAANKKALQKKPVSSISNTVSASSGSTDNSTTNTPNSSDENGDAQ